MPTDRSRLAAFRFAWQGVRNTFRRQPNFRIQAGAGLVAIGAALAFRFDALRWALILATVLLVLAFELVNTSIEALVDALHPDLHPAAKTSKDAAAGAVLVVALLAVAVGACLFGPPLLDLLRR